jgi:dipeptidyl aminopeptidase/acylaminoacyl peptidase
MKACLQTVILVFLFSICIAQKKPLDHSVYDSWQHIGEKMISNDGKWVVYTIDPQQGDNELVIQSSDAKYKMSVSRGYNALITEDSRYLIFKIKPFYKETREAKIKKKKPDEMPKDSLAIVELGKEAVWKKELVKNYKTPQKSFGWLAYQLEKPIEQPGKKLSNSNIGKADNKVTDSLKRIIDSLQQQILMQSKKKKKDGDETTNDNSVFNNDSIDADGDETVGNAGETGNDLVVRNISSGEEVVFYKVLEYYFSKNGNKLLIEQARNPIDSFSIQQVVLYDLKAGKSVILSKGGNEYKNFAMTEDGEQVAYIAERDAKPKELQKFFRLWYYNTGMDSATLLADKNAVGMKLGLTISEYGNLSFSKNGKRVFFGTAPIQAPKDTTLVDFENAKVDIWHYNDDYLQTVQNYPARLKAAQQENFLAVYNLDSKTIKQLGSKEIPQVMQTNEGDGDTFVGVTDVGKRIESQWRGNTLKDIYAIDVTTGEKKLVKENLFGQVYPSSTGKYIMWYDRKARNYFAWDGATTRNFTSSIKVPLWNEDFDTPDEPNNYGLMGWHQGDSAAYVYDKYDIWKIPFIAGLKPVNITGIGRSGKSRIRYVVTDPEQKYFKNEQPVFYKLFNETNKTEEIIESSIKDWLSFELVENGNYLINTFLKAKNKNTVLFSKESFNNPPDLFCKELVANDLEKSIQLSNINPQQKDYLWGTAELFNWKAYNGKEATGIVYKPENFDPKKKYPMIVYFYEKLSQELYDYKEPAPIRSAINVPFFVSRGYIIFMPDIEYKIGYPGKSAYDYIVSGARALVKKGWVDSTNMALQGHSWGGYQAAQVATMTKLFKAVWAGAPVANMTSAYGGIRWESGVSRQFQYEKTQSRIGGTLWEKLPLYLENSPLFHLDKVSSPMVIMANDADGAVPWYQGIELFTGLRRLGKKVWMFNYNGQGHGLTQRQDMKDYQIRMQQFFDWILKGEKPAKWITEGVPAVNKGKDWGLEIVD